MAGRAGHRDPFHRRARQAVLRDRREYRHEAGRRRALDRRKLAVLHALCGAAAGRGRLSPAMRCCASRSTSASASVMGFVGAGGIGQELVVAIRKFYYSDVSAILLTDHRHRLRHRYRHRLAARHACSARMRAHEPVAETGSGTRSRREIPDVFDRPASARLAMPAMIVGCVRDLRASGWSISISRRPDCSSGLSQLGWITLMMIPPDPGLVAAGLSRSARRDAVDRAARHHLGRRAGAAGQPAGGAEHRSVESAPLPGAPLSRFHPRRRYADLGAGLDQRRRPRPVRRRAGDRAVRFRRVRQIVFRGDRGRRQEAGRGHPVVRRQRAARASASA